MDKQTDLRQERFQKEYIEVLQHNHGYKHAVAVAKHATYYLQMAALYSPEEWRDTAANVDQVQTVTQRICGLMNYDVLQKLGEPESPSMLPVIDDLIAKISLSMCLATRFYIRHNRFLKGNECLRAGLAGARLIQDTQWECNLTNDLGLWHKTRGQMQPALAYYRASAKLSIASKDKIGLAATINNMGTIYNSSGQTKKAIAHFRKTQQICEATGNSAILVDVLNNLALAYLHQEEYASALSTCIYAQEICEEKGNLSGLALAFNNKGLVLSAQNEYDKALSAFQQALGLREQVGSFEEQATTLSNISSIHWSLGQIDKALDYLQQALALFEKAEAVQYIVAVNHNLGILQHDTGQLQDAISSTRRALALAEEHTLFYDGSGAAIDTIRKDLSRWEAEYFVSTTFANAGTVGQLLEAFIATEDLEAAQAYLQTHPILLEEHTHQLLLRSTHILRDLDAEMHGYYMLHYDLLLKARTYGIQRGFLIWQGETSEHQALAELVIQFVMQEETAVSTFAQQYPILFTEDAFTVLKQLLKELEDDISTEDIADIERVRQRISFLKSQDFLK